MKKTCLVTFLFLAAGLVSGPGLAQGRGSATMTPAPWVLVAQESCTRHRGTVKWFDAGRGYGFIVPARCSAEPCHDVQVHYSDLRSNASLAEGQEVCYSLGERSGLPYAYDVVVIGW